MADKTKQDEYDVALLNAEREETLRYLKKAPSEDEERKAYEHIRDALIAIYGEGFERVFSGGLRGQYFSNFGGVGNVGVKKGQGFLPDLDKFEGTDVAAAYTKEIEGETYGDRWKNFLERMGSQGFHENRSQIGQISGAGSLAWCGGYTHMCAERVFGGQLFMQNNPLWARSFTDYAAKYDARADGAPPKDFDFPCVAALPGAGASGCHVVTIIGYNEKTGKYIISEGNGSNLARVKEIDARRIVAYVDTNKLLMERAKRGEAVIGPDGQPILSLDQEVSGKDVPPQEWTRGEGGLFDENGPTEKLKLGRALGKLLAEGGEIASGISISGNDQQARNVELLAALDINNDNVVDIKDMDGITVAEDADGAAMLAALAKAKQEASPAVQQ
ncbi:MAG: hypothetical protein MRY32_02440 [Rickettsiales bacterium]|nr:hypothetical protein [Rickettsiales bacterium]